MPISAVVFDLDYTLAVTETDRQTLLDRATAAVGAPSMTREEYLAAHGRNLTSEDREPIFAAMLADRDSGVDPADLAEAYREAIAESLAPVDDAEALLAALRGRFRLGLLTNGPLVAQGSKLDELGWREFFDAVVITGDLDAGKPDERAFRAVLDELGVGPDEAVYVGDDVEKDIQGAKQAGLYAVQVCFDGGPDRDPAADAYVERDRLREEFPAVLESLDP